MDKKTLGVSLLCTSIFAMGYLLNVALFQILSWILVFISLILGAVSFWTALYGSDELLAEAMRKNPDNFSRKKYISAFFWSIPFWAANLYVFNGHQIQYVYLFSFVLIVLFNFGLVGRANRLANKPN